MSTESNKEIIFENTSFPSINIQNSPEETYYGKFRSVVKQRFFGLKLDESTFMEFIDSDLELKDSLEKFITMMERLRDDYINFLKKNYPDKIEKRKKKRKGKKKDSAALTLEVPKLDSDCYSSDNSGIFSSSRDDLDTTTTNELQVLRNKIESIKKDFTFDSVENVAKNIHLFDDFFGKMKAEQTKSQQMDQLKQFQQFNLNFGQAEGKGFGLFGDSSSNGQAQELDKQPACFHYFQELYSRWDEAINEVGTHNNMHPVE